MQTFVSFVVDDEIHIENVTVDLQNALIEIGAIKDPKEEWWILHGENKKEIADHFATLRDLGIAFSTGKEWNPAELFEYYRELDLLNGTYKKISWWGPNDYRVTEGN